ncbi:MAG: hypothetical protein HY983_01270, partial [Candidatus Magasanikbacteria bacterium]|nr:hypothetical protein [Candidatus Magasanikbacteria bacterium]
MAPWTPVENRLRRERKNQKFKLLELLELFFLLLAVIGAPQLTAAASGVPRILNHQGRLLDSSSNLLGTSAGTNYCFRFSFFDSPAIGSGSRVWPTPDTATSTMTVNVKNGVFNVGIGDTSAGGNTLDFDFQSTSTIYLNIEVANSVSGSCAAVTSFENLTPRQSIVSAGYAINAGSVLGTGQSAVGTTTPVSGAVLTVQATTTNAVALAIRAATSQAVDLLEIQNAAASKLLYVNASGGLFASSTLQVTGATQLYNSLGVDGLATLVGGFISNASSSIGAALTVSGNLAASSTLGVTATTSLYSAFLQSGLTTCNGSSNKVVYNAGNGLFGCDTDQTSGGGGSVFTNPVTVTIGSTMANLRSNSFYLATSTANLLGLFGVDGSGNVSASGTLDTFGLATFKTGFISNASSSVGAGLQVAGALNASSTFQVAGAVNFGSTLDVIGLLTASQPIISSGIVAGSSTIGGLIVTSTLSLPANAITDAMVVDTITASNY